MKIYLGDGLYAEYDGWQFRLFTERMNGTHEVYLEPDVMETFFAFVEKAWNVTITVKKKEAEEQNVEI